MKKLFIVLLVLILLLSAAACGKQKPADRTKTVETSADTPVDGGWGEAQSIAVSGEVSAMFDKLNETLAGAYYVPVVYLSSQVVAGTNHKVLCKLLPSTGGKDAVGEYVIVTVYEDPQRKAEITEVLYSGAAAPQPYDPDHPSGGGWSEPKSFEPTEEAKTAVKKANEKAGSNRYDPVALLGEQVVAGMNYRMLCRQNPAEASPSEYVILTVYADLQGNAEITDIAGFGAEEPRAPAGEGSASSQAE